LSNSTSKNKKVISIKKLAEIFEQKSETESYVHENETTLQLKVDQLKNDIENLQLQKERVLQDLQAAIQEEKQVWEQEKESEKKAAQEVGYKVGYDAGYEEVLKQHNMLLAEANEIVKLAKQDYDKTISKHESAIVNLAIAAAEKITTTSIEEYPEYFSKVVEEAILDLKDSSNVEIIVNPSKYELIMSQKSELEQLVREDDVISIYTNKHLCENSCTIKHPYGQIDVGIDVQLQQIKHALEEKITER